MSESSSSSTAHTLSSQICSALRSAALKQHWQQAHVIGLQLSSPQALQDGSFKFYHHSKNDLAIFYKDIPNDISIVRGEGICEKMKAEEFLNTFLSNDMTIRKQFDAHVMRSEIVERWKDQDGEWFVEYFASPSLAMISSRDFVNIYHIETLPKSNEFIYTSTSVPESIGYQLPSNVSTVKGAVRGVNVVSTLRLQQLENGDLKMVYVNHAKPNGWIPFSVINASIFGVPQVLKQTALYLRSKLRPLNHEEPGLKNLKQ